jgi:uncharacterized protein (TIGR02996 family)
VVRTVRDCSWLRPVCVHAEEEAFLAAILQRPGDDLPRLVYADWLEERGDPRADFLRAWHAVKTGLATPEEGARERELRGSLNQGWLAVVGVAEVTGTVTRITQYGYIVDLGGLTGEANVENFLPPIRP